MEIPRDFCARVELENRKLCIAPAITTTVFENKAELVYTSTMILEVFTAVTKLYARRIAVAPACSTSTIALTAFLLPPTCAFRAQRPAVLRGTPRFPSVATIRAFAQTETLISL